MTLEEGDELLFETRSFEPYLYDGDPVLLKGRMGLRYLAKVSINEDVPKGKAGICICNVNHDVFHLLTNHLWKRVDQYE